MLYLSAIDPPALELLSALMHSEKLKHLRLAGDTALALQTGHRKSVDLDLFGEIDFGQIDTNLLFKEVEAVTILKRTENINIFSINGIKVDFVNYSYRWIDDILIVEGIRLARTKDIAAMKLAAITGRGSKKDFVDLYFLLKHFSFNEMLGFYTQKYPDGSAYLLLKSMTYFEDAKSEPMPDMLVDLSWQQVKDLLLDTVFEYNRSLL